MGKRSREVNAWNKGGAIVGDGEGTDEEEEAIGIQPTWGPIQLSSRGCAYVGGHTETLTSGFDFRYGGFLLAF